MHLEEIKLDIEVEEEEEDNLEEAEDQWYATTINN
jgi:hypothetical protein